MKTGLKRRAALPAKSWVGTMVVTVVITLSFKSAVADWNVVPTGSMKPTIVEGDRILVNRLAYDLRVPFTQRSLVRRADPSRGDIVVFSSPRDGQRLVKRVIGLPGDRVEMSGERLFINGAPAGYDVLVRAEGHLVAVEKLDGLDHRVMITPDRPALRSFGPIEVPAGKYLVLGDNRDNSADSRYFGFVDRAALQGKAVMVVLSLDYGNHHAPRRDRFFKDLY